MVDDRKKFILNSDGNPITKRLTWKARFQNVSRNIRVTMMSIIAGIALFATVIGNLDRIIEVFHKYYPVVKPIDYTPALNSTPVSLQPPGVYLRSSKQKDERIQEGDYYVISADEIYDNPKIEDVRPHSLYRAVLANQRLTWDDITFPK